MDGFLTRGLTVHRLAIIGVGLFSVAGFVVAASAADLPARTYTKAPPPPVVAAYNWFGIYVGANGGVA